MRDLNELGEELVSKMPELKPKVEKMSEVFADIVFSYRVRKGLTQIELAEKADLSPKTIHRIEGGSGGITDKTYDKVFEALDIDPREAIVFFWETQNKFTKAFSMA